MKPHGLEIRAANHARADLPRFAHSHHAESDGGEIAEFAERLHARAQIVQLRHREIHIVSADSRRALVKVNQPVLVAIDQRLEQHSAHQSEDGSVRPDAERQCQDHNDRQPWTSSKRTSRNSQIVKNGHFLNLPVFPDAARLPLRFRSCPRLAESPKCCRTSETDAASPVVPRDSYPAPPGFRCRRVVPWFPRKGRPSWPLCHSSTTESGRFPDPEALRHCPSSRWRAYARRMQSMRRTWRFVRPPSWHRIWLCRSSPNKGISWITPCPSPAPGRTEARAPRRAPRTRWPPPSRRRVPHPYWG